jgi:hypothetical protein
MLSDTAMVLLRRYVEYEDYILAIETAIYEQEQSPTMVQGMWSRTHNSPRNALRDLQREIKEDIWHLWKYPDLPVIRHLSWHLTLTQDLMDAISHIWGPRRVPTRPSPLSSIVMSPHAFPLLVSQYKKGLEAHAKTTP